MDYTSKFISLEQALSMVKSNDYIVTGLGAAEAGAFMGALHTIAPRVRNVTLTDCLPLHPAEFRGARYRDSFRVDSWFYSGVERQARKEGGSVSFIPNHLRQAGVRWLAHRIPNLDVGAATRPDKHGYISLSCSNIYEKRMLEAADLVILEVNPNMPFTLGDLQVPVSDVDYMVRVDYPVPELISPPLGDRDRAIGKFIADMVPDASCIQLGIGSIPNAVAEALKTKNDLGLHTEMLTTGMMELARLGVLTGKYKQAERGKLVAAFAVGTRELYDFIDLNPGVAIMDGNWVNDPYVISRNDNQVSINTALEVDLTGQCASESLGSRQFSGTGGQAETAMGAQRSRGGKSIIALYSTAMVKGTDGVRREVSKIVPQLMAGAAVSLSRNDVDRVVTEYGVAELRGTSLRERVEQLVAIAHPRFRDELRIQARACGIID